MRWTGHLARMPGTSLPKRLLFYVELKEGKRNLGGQKKCFKDTIKVSFKSFDIDPESWDETAKTTLPGGV